VVPVNANAKQSFASHMVTKETEKKDGEVSISLPVQVVALFALLLLLCSVLWLLSTVFSGTLQLIRNSSSPEGNVR
jgi:hypothetical protein